MAGTPGGGIRTFKQLEERCVKTDTGCLIWRGAKNGQGNPQAWYPPLASVRSVAVIAYHLKHGELPPRYMRYVSVCGEDDCIAHRKLKSVSEILTGIRTPVHTAKLALANRERRAKLTEEIAAEIRESAETGVALALKFGVSETTISRVKLGQGWKPIVIPGSSIFNLGG